MIFNLQHVVSTSPNYPLFATYCVIRLATKPLTRLIRLLSPDHDVNNISLLDSTGVSALPSNRCLRDSQIITDVTITGTPVVHKKYTHIATYIDTTITTATCTIYYTPPNGTGRLYTPFAKATRNYTPRTQQWRFRGTSQRTSRRRSSKCIH